MRTTRTAPAPCPGETRTPRRARRLWLVPLVAALAPGLTAAAQGPGLEPRVEVARCTTAPGTLLTRREPGRAWDVPGEKDAVRSRDLILALPGVRADIEPKAGGVRLTLWGNFPDLEPFPVLESAAVLHDTRAYDLDFTLDRGRVVVANTKKEGAARVWLRLPGTGWEFVLPSPGDAVALEMAGRVQRGTGFRRDLRESPPPTLLLNLHVLKGNVTFHPGRGAEHGLSAPPGLAYFSWDSLTGPDEGPRRRDKLPEWAEPGYGKKLSPALRSELEALAKLPKDEAIGAALGRWQQSAVELSDADRARVRRRLSVFALGAIDDLEQVTDALASTESSVLREAAVEALRHWIGRAPAQDQRLFRFLVLRQEYSEPHAETVLDLLHSPFAPDRPETYETLIAYLRHSRVAVRELARWHLSRLAPAGRDIAYDAADPEEQRRKAYDEWKKLVPSGKLPPPPGKKEKDRRER
jgi:hypothetical protein